MVTAIDGNPSRVIEKTVQRATDRTDTERDQHGEEHFNVMFEEIAERRTGQSKHRGDGQVDLASRDDQHLGQRHDRNQSEIDTREEDGVLARRTATSRIRRRRDRR